MLSLPTSTFPLLRALLLWALNHILSAREPSTELALQERAYFCGTRRASHMTSLAYLEIAPSKDFSAFFSTSFIPDPSNPTLFSCSELQQMVFWKEKYVVAFNSPLLHPSLTYPWSYFFHILLSSKFTCIDIFLLKWWPPQPQFFIHSSLKYKLVTLKTNSAGNTVIHFQVSAEAFNIIVLFAFFFFLKMF